MSIFSDEKDNWDNGEKYSNVVSYFPNENGSQQIVVLKKG